MALTQFKQLLLNEPGRDTVATCQIARLDTNYFTLSEKVGFIT